MADPLKNRKQSAWTNFQVYRYNVVAEVTKRFSRRFLLNLIKIVRKPGHISLIFNNSNVSLTSSHKYFWFIFDKQMIFQHNIRMILSEN